MDFWLYVFSLAAVYSLACVSLVILTGWTGQLNLHIAALGLGWGSYAAFALTAYGVPTVWALLLAGVVTIPFAAAVGAVAVRFRGLELAVATLAIGLIFERLAFRNIGKALAQRVSGGTTPFESSFVRFERPSIAGSRLDGDAVFFLFSVVFVAAVVLLVANLARSGTGRVMRAVREREVMAESLGIPVLRYRVGAFVLSIAVASAAGALLASLKEGITPDSFNLDVSFALLAGAVIGGIRSLRGAVIGGSLAAVLPEVVQYGPLQIFDGERFFVLFGIGMILTLWRLPAGLAGLRSRPHPVGGASFTEDPPAFVEPVVPSNGRLTNASFARQVATPLERALRQAILRTDGIRKRFGGVVALDGVDIRVASGEIAALIGPNGAGKSTLFDCVTGLLEPDAGRVYFEGDDVTELSPHRRAARGIGRTFQTVEAFRELTVRENLIVAGYATRTSGPFADALRLRSARRDDRKLSEQADEIAETLGLDAAAHREAGDLPLGLLRVLEVGMALAPRPRLLLLDEPSAGLDSSETAALGELIARARSAYGLSVLLVEHDMSLVGRLAEHVWVLDFGSIIAEGTPESVRRDPVVIERYLGKIGAASVRPRKEVARARR